MKINFRKFLNKWAKFGLGYSLFLILSFLIIISIPLLRTSFLYLAWVCMFFIVWFAYVIIGAVILIIQIFIEVLQKFKNSRSSF